MRRLVVPFISGVLFAIGLGIAQMTSPSKVLAFLDIASPSWDPSLAFVMIGAIGTHFLVAQHVERLIKTNRRPIGEAQFYMPMATSVDRPLLIGAAIFGVGWGLAGYCPGPGIVAIASANPSSILWVASMLAGMWLTRRLLAGRGTSSLPRTKGDLPKPEIASH